MIGGTILIGLGIAHLNVLMPAFLMVYAPNKIALYTSAYSFSMMFGMAFQSNPTGSIQNIIYVLVIIMLTAMGLFVAKPTKFE